MRLMYFRFRHAHKLKAALSSGLLPISSSLSIRTSRTPRRASARIALHAGAVPHQREVAALAAHLAFVAFGLGFGAAFGLGRRGGLRGAGLAPLQGFQLFGRRQVVLGFLLQRDRAFERCRRRGRSRRGRPAR